jgi:hypothetical protein
MASISMTRLSPTSIALSIALVTAAACADGDAPRVTLRDSAGITIAENAPDALDRAAAWRVDSQPMLSIGELEGDSVYQLYRVGGAARLADGRIAVLNSGTRELRFYDGSGKHLRSVGRKGAGPGEFQYPYPLLRLPHDTLALWDEGQQRITVLSPAGDYVRMTRVDQPMVNAEIVGVFADGSIAMADFRLEVPNAGFAISNAVFTRYTRDGVFSDSLGVYPWYEIGQIAMNGGRGVGSRTFAPRTATALHGDRFWVGTAVDPSIEVHDQRGKLTRLVRWNAGDRTVGPGDVEARLLARYPDPTPEQRRNFASIPVMDRFPAYSSMRADVDGNLWVEEYRRPTATGPGRWLVFDPDGALLARVELPPALEILEIGRDYLLGMHPGEDDLERVVLYSLRR